MPNNLTPVLQLFVIDWNRFKERLKRPETRIQIAIETIGNGDKRKRTCWSVHAKRTRIYVTSVSENEKYDKNKDG